MRLSVCGSDDRAPIPFISRVYYFVTGDQTRSTIVSEIVCMPRMASPILLVLDRLIDVGGQFMLRSPKEDGRGSRQQFVLAGNAGGAVDAHGGGIPPRPHDLSKIGAIYRANQERVATRGHGRPAGRVC